MDRLSQKYRAANSIFIHSIPSYVLEYSMAAQALLRVASSGGLLLG
jgi:hypothetical protein